MEASATQLEGAPPPSTADGPTWDEARLGAALHRLRAAFRNEPAPHRTVRAERLAALRDAVLARQDAFVAAVSADFGGRSAIETRTLGILPLVHAIGHTLGHLDRWMADEPKATTWYLLPARSRVVRQPKGVVGVIGPWNYPILLTLQPLAQALSAGCRVLVKPSEITPRTSALVAELVAATFPDHLVDVALGGSEVGASFASLPFDHLFFTGSTAVGRKVMEAAARHLVPVTLELGGKSPVVLAPDFPLGEAADRITFGKLMNAGQTCVAPDTALVVGPGRVDAFVAAMRASVARTRPQLVGTDDYSAIVSERHAARLRHLVEDARAKGATVIDLQAGQESFDPAVTRKLPPCLVLNPTEEMLLSQEEIFGPILSVVSVPDLSAALGWVQDRPRPLALYVFTRDGEVVDRVRRETVSGGLGINELVVHLGVEDLPFGGVGASGMGAYHGEDGFLTFTHRKAVFHQSRFHLMALAEPPYKDVLRRALDALLRR